MSSDFHIGRKIKEVWKHSGLKGAEFADRLHRQRQSIYHLFKQESIDSLLLKKISEVLQHDFFKHYSEQLSIETEKTSADEEKSLKTLSGSIDRLSMEVKHLAQTQYNKGA